MTITTNPARNEYTATAGQTVFNYTFKIYVNTDLNVYVTPDGQVADDATDITTDYVVDANTIGDPAGGFITFNTPLNLNDKVTIVSAIPDDRTTDYQFNGDFQPDTVNNDFDRTVSLVKQLENDVNRTIQFQESQQGASALTLPAPVADNLIKWKSDLSGFENTDGTGIGGIDAAVAAAQAAQAGAETAETNANTSASSASTSETNAATSYTDTLALYNDFFTTYYGALAADPATDPLGNPPTEGDLYFNTSGSNMRQYNGLAWQDIVAAQPIPDGSITTAKIADGAVTQVKLGADVSLSTSSMSRNQVLNENPITQGSATRVGFSATTYTGNGTSQSISTGVDMATGDFGGLVWVKSRGSATGHNLFDTVRGSTVILQTNNTNADSTDAQSLTGFTATGFDVGTNIAVNASADTLVSWSWQTTDKTTGTTNQNKAYTAHYNAEMGFSIVGYEGSGTANHEIPHHLGAEPELTIIKDRDQAVGWAVQGKDIGDRSAGDYLEINTTAAIANASSIASFVDASTFSVGSAGRVNTSTNNYISYNFRSIEGVSKIGKYIGTGAAGNYVDCGFKPAFVLIKNLDNGTTNWEMYDSPRSGSNIIWANLSNAENTGTQRIDFVDDGFVLIDTQPNHNELNSEHLFLAFADTNATTGRTDYSYPTTDDTLTINGLASFAEGFSTSGETNNQELYTNQTFTLGAGFEDKKYYLYKDKDGSFGVTEYRPLEEQDYSGVPSPLGGGTRTTAKHFDYESSTGVASASGEISGQEAWNAFQSYDFISGFDSRWRVAVTTNSQLQYKYNEPRVLKSWRMRERDSTQNETPRRFTIEGSNDGLNWTAIDSTYTSSDYSGNSPTLWGDLQDTSGNTTAYIYHRINITANNGSGTHTCIADLEFNTITPSDRYDLTDGVIYNNAGSAIQRVYLGEFRTDTNGDVINNTIVNYTPNKAKIKEAEVHGDLTVRGEIDNNLVDIAQVSFDGTQNPPLIRARDNISAVVDSGTGIYDVKHEPLNEGRILKIGCSRNSGDTFCYARPLNTTTTRITTVNEAGTNVDADYVYIGISRGKE